MTKIINLKNNVKSISSQIIALAIIIKYKFLIVIKVY